jgi:hypothetical protein
MVMTAGFMVMILTHSNNPPTGKVPITETEKGMTGEKQSQVYAHNFLCPKQHDCHPLSTLLFHFHD